MNTLLTAGTDSVARRAGAGRSARWLTALLLPIGPAAVAALRYVLPYDTTDDPAAVVSKVAAHPAAQDAVLWLGLVAALTLVPGLFAAGRLTSRRAPRLTAAAMLLAVPGYLALNVMLAGDILLAVGVRGGLDPATLTALYAAPHPVQDFATAIFVAGHVLGVVLLGAALWHSQAVPRWAAALTAASQPLHVIAAVVLVSHPLDLIAWGLTAAGMAAVGVALVREPDGR
jgi:hypothetical protein